MAKSRGLSLVFPGKMGGKKEWGELPRAVCANTNRLNEKCKSREMCEIFTRGNPYVLGVGETHLKGCSIWDSRSEDGKGLHMHQRHGHGT